MNHKNRFDELDETKRKKHTNNNNNNRQLLKILSNVAVDKKIVLLCWVRHVCVRSQCSPTFFIFLFLFQNQNVCVVNEERPKHLNEMRQAARWAEFQENEKKEKEQKRCYQKRKCNKNYHYQNLKREYLTKETIALFVEQKAVYARAPVCQNTTHRNCN